MDERLEDRLGILLCGVVVLLTATILGATIITAASTSLTTGRIARADQRSTSTGPQLIEGDVSDTLVRVRGGAACSGTPITGTFYVATAAHCALDVDGRPGRRTVVRGDESFEVKAVWVDTRYADVPSPRFDAAILELGHAVPGPSATLGTSFPTSGSATIAGYQPIDTDGTLLRGDNPYDRPLPEGATGGVVEIESRPAGCRASVEEIDVTPIRVDVTCGLIPSASGGGVYVDDGDQTTLVGIISTVSYDLTSNGVVPLASVHELLDNPADYRHQVDTLTPDAIQLTRS